jgi:hypothetical protein
MAYGILNSRGKSVKKKVKARKILVIASLCLCLFVFGPHYHAIDTISVITKPVLAQTTGDNQDSTSSSSDDGDTPSAEDRADFSQEFDQDGDGEVDAPDDEDEDDSADQADPDEADQDDEADDSDDVGDEDEYDDDIDGEETQNDEDDDMPHTGKNRDDIDGEASPEYSLSGYDRYLIDGTLRRLGEREALTPLIYREERMLLEN